eukprot:TRINITY_DN56895_c0_g1_i1.p3 TRINITY_DN56895_c0_g1~~TRINITY_DN56895_c0_g1_i1.p3  ORF type:complete len:131 (+),score=41.51 TRINITY_DN56895_c0_g1_i1:56-448(+)
MSTQVSSDLIWRAIKNQNAFLKKQRFGRGREGVKMSCEPRNLTQRSSFKHSGLAHKSGVGMKLGEKGLVVVQADKNGIKNKETTVKLTKAVGMGSKLRSKGRKDLQSAGKACGLRLTRLSVRKTRKTWKA